MKMFRLLPLLVVLSWTNSLLAQSDLSHSYRNFPIILSVRFHALSMPFKQMDAAFRNIGFGIGTELSYNGKANWVQELELVWYRNKAVGNGWLLSTQMAWRPRIVSELHSGIRAGIGYLYTFRPTRSFVQKNNAWTRVGKVGKGMLAVPLGISVEYYRFQEQAVFNPFLGYQFLVLKDYNPSIPIVPATFLQLGNRFF